MFFEKSYRAFRETGYDFSKGERYAWETVGGGHSLQEPFRDVWRAKKEAAHATSSAGAAKRDMNFTTGKGVVEMKWVNIE